MAYLYVPYCEPSDINPCDKLYHIGFPKVEFEELSDGSVKFTVWESDSPSQYQKDKVSALAIVTPKGTIKGKGSRNSRKFLLTVYKYYKLAKGEREDYPQELNVFFDELIYDPLKKDGEEDDES